MSCFHSTGLRAIKSLTCFNLAWVGGELSKANETFTINLHVKPLFLTSIVA
jgi:hypothetical protein